MVFWVLGGVVSTGVEERGSVGDGCVLYAVVWLAAALYVRGAGSAVFLRRRRPASMEVVSISLGRCSPLRAYIVVMSVLIMLAISSSVTWKTLGAACCDVVGGAQKPC